MILCPFEKTKKWYSGVSIKCPYMTEVLWTRDDKDTALKRLIVAKRKFTCRECKDAILTFFGLEVD